MTTFRYTVSFEFDTAPVDTHRGEIEAEDAEDAIRRALRRIIVSRRRAGKYRSLVAVVEDLAEVRAKRPNVSGPSVKPIPEEGLN